MITYREMLALVEGLSPRTWSVVAAVLEAAGLLSLWLWLWPGVVMVGAGLACQWRAGVAREEARAAAWFAATRDREEPPE